MIKMVLAKTFTIRFLRKLLLHLEPAQPQYRQGLEFEKRTENKKLIIGIGVGRSGKRWLSEVFNAHQEVQSMPEPFPVLESFYWYSNWNKLPVDHSGFFNLIQLHLSMHYKMNDLVYLSSPWLGMGLDDIDKHLNPDRYFFNMRDPVKVVNSMLAKGWFQEKTIKKNHSLATGLQPVYQNLHHHFSRLTPLGNDFLAWNELTPVGKCAWYWNSLNMAIHNDLKNIEPDRVRIFKLEDIDQNYEFYLSIAQEYNLSPLLSRKAFLAVKDNMPNIGKKSDIHYNWAKQEKEEFDAQISSFYTVFKEVTSST